MMKWIRYSALAGSIFCATLVAPDSLAQTAQPKSIPDGTASLEGTVQDATSKTPLTGVVVSASSLSGTLRAQRVITGSDGSFKFLLDPKQSYSITAQATGYDPHVERLAFTSSSANRLYGKVIRLSRTGTSLPDRSAFPEITARAPASQPVASASPSTSTGAQLTPPKTLDAKVMYTPPPLVAAMGKITKLEAIQFVQSKADLLPDAQPAMQQLLTFMQTHPTTEILLAGHTDNQGDFDANVKLSQDRVDVVKNFLVSNGITANRITAKGYGPTRPVASNSRESSRQQNRRVEMTVVKE